MSGLSWTRRLSGTVTLLGALVLLSQVAWGQSFVDLKNLPSPQLDPTPPAVLKALDTALGFQQQGQFDEAAIWLRQFAEEGSGSLIELKGQSSESPEGFRRWVPLESFANWKLLQLYQASPELSQKHRATNAAAAAASLKELAQRGADAITSAQADNLVENVLLSSELGDRALLLRGDQALERGHFSTARHFYWRIDPHVAKWQRQLDSTQGFAPDTRDATPTDADSAAQNASDLPWKSFIGTTLPLGEVWGRLTLVSILEGSVTRAERELEFFKNQFPKAEMILGGRKLQGERLFEELQRLLQTTRVTLESTAKLTAPDRVQLGKLIWSRPLPEISGTREVFAAQRVWPGDDAHSLRSYFPLLVKSQVLLAVEARHHSQVISLELESGKSLWYSAMPRGILGRDAANASSLLGADHLPTQSDIHEGLTHCYGAWRSQLQTTASGELYLRAGPPASGVPSSRQPKLLSRDLNQMVGIRPYEQGKAITGFPFIPESTAWSFEGPPLADDGKAYVVMRKSDGALRQLYLASFDVNSTPPESANGQVGALLWRTRLLSGPGLTSGTGYEIGHVSVLKEEGVLYCNCGAGLVVAVRAEGGNVLWSTSYPRTGTGESVDEFPPEHLFRDGAGCLVWNDLIICMPYDYRGLFALDRFTGEVRWTLPGVALDARHFLGVQDGVLLISGDVLYWLDVQKGSVLTQFPGISPAASQVARVSPRGIGRGWAGTKTAYFPTRSSVFLFDMLPQKQGDSWQPVKRGEWDLAAHGAEGGNLLIHGQGVLLATGNRLFAFGDQVEKTDKAQPVAKAAVTFQSP